MALKSELINGYVGDFVKEEREEMDDILEECVEFVSTEFIPESAAETHDMTMWLSKELNANRSSVMKVENMFRKGREFFEAENIGFYGYPHFKGLIARGVGQERCTTTGGDFLWKLFQVRLSRLMAFMIAICVRAANRGHL